MKLFSQKEKAFYLFKDNSYENGVVCHTFDFIPGSLVSSLFTLQQAIEYLAKADSSIKFVGLPEPYCFVRTRNKTYCAKYDWNFSSIVGSIVEPTTFPIMEDSDFLAPFAENDGELYFFKDNDGVMVDLWLNDKRGSFRFTNYGQFRHNIDRFHERN